ncbi:CZB domain-containing protein [Sulfurimonas sp.]
MTKEKILKAIENSKDNHTNLASKVGQLISGKDVNDLHALTDSECEFGKWMSSDTALKKNILGSQFYIRLDTVHLKWHREFLNICDIFKDEKQKGVLSKLFSSGIEPMKLDKAKFYFRELESVTEELVNALDVSYRRVAALSDNKFLQES